MRSLRANAIATLCLVLAACRAEPGPGADDGGDVDVSASEVGEGASGAEAAVGDPLLAEARAALASGELPEDLRTKIVASKLPAHARARRILLAMDGEPVPETSDAGADEKPQRPPDLSAPAPEKTVETSGSDAPSVQPPPAATSSSSSGAGDAAGQPQLALITKFELRKGKRGVELVVRAAKSVEIGTAAQLQTGTLRYVLPSAGALPTALQARPKVGGVAITDVRRGDGTVQLAVELDEGWRAGDPISTPTGAKITFQGP